MGEVHGAFGGVFVEVGGFYGGVVLTWWSLGGLRLLDERGGVLDFRDVC